MESVTRIQILDEFQCVFLRANALSKYMNLSVFLSCGYIVAQFGFFNLGKATSLGEGKF